MGLDHRGADHLSIQNDGKGAADIVARVIAKCARTRWVKAEVYRRTVVLIKAGLRIHQFLARNNGGRNKRVIDTFVIQRRQHLVSGTCGDIGVPTASNDRLECQLRCCADNLFQLGR